MKSRLSVRSPKLIFAALLGLSLLSGVAAQPDLPTPSVTKARVLAPQVVVSPDHADWSYSPGDLVVFTIRVLSDGHSVPGAKVRYRVGPEKFEQEH